MISSRNTLTFFNAYEYRLKKVMSVIALLEDYIGQTPNDNEIIKDILMNLHVAIEAIKLVKMAKPNKAEKKLQFIIEEIKSRIEDDRSEETRDLCVKINEILQVNIVHSPFTPPKEQLKLNDIRWVPINRICFRGDDRDPDIIFSNGFTPKPMKADEVIINPVLVSHPGVVQCTSRFAAALFFPMQTEADTWVYIVKLEHGFNVHMHGNEALTDPTTNLIKMDINCAYKMFVHELITDEIPADKIIAAVQIKRNRDHHDKYDFPQLCTNVGSYQIISFRMNNLCQVSNEEKALATAFIRDEMVASSSNTNLVLPSVSYKYNFNFDLIKDTPEISQRTATSPKLFNTPQLVLFRSILRYDLATITKCLKKGADINAVNTEEGCTPLFAVIDRALKNKNMSQNDLRLITFLLDHGADVHVQNSLNQSITSMIVNHIILCERLDDINLIKLLKILTKDSIVYDMLHEKIPHLDEILSGQEKANNTKDTPLEPIKNVAYSGCLFMRDSNMHEITKRYSPLLKALSITEDSKEFLDDIFLWENILSDLSNYREIGVHPRNTFEIIIRYLDYMNSDDLLKLAEEDERVSMAILLTPDLLDRLGTHKVFFSIFGCKHENVALHILRTKTMLKDCDDITLVHMGIAHAAAAKIILEDINIRTRISSYSIEKIENAHNNKAFSMSY